MKRETNQTYESVLERVPELLKAQGFGVLTEIDIKDTLKKKIDIDFRRYQILGACNPPLAHRALAEDLDVGVLLPCNVVVYEMDDDRVVVSAVDPVAAIGTFGGDEPNKIAVEVRGKLEQVLEALG